MSDTATAGMGIYPRASYRGVTKVCGELLRALPLPSSVSPSGLTSTCVASRSMNNSYNLSI